MTNLKFKPVVAFDVDGVLRVRKLNDFDDDLTPHTITLEEDEYPDYYHGEPKWDENGTSTGTHYFVSTAVDFLQETVSNDQVAAVWATTWQRWANYYFAAPLGIPEIPVAVKKLEPISENASHCSPDWKSMQLARQFDGRPLIWIDDNVPDRYYEGLEYRRRPIDRAITLTYQVNPFLGITKEDIEEINKWLELVSTEDGQKQLRDERNKKIQKEYSQRVSFKKKSEREGKVFEKNLQKLENVFPGKDILNRSLASASKHPYMSVETIESSLKRHKTVANAQEIHDLLWVPRYHKKIDASELAAKRFLTDF